jgi:hypothetical protein
MVNVCNLLPWRRKVYNKKKLHHICIGIVRNCVFNKSVIKSLKRMKSIILTVSKLCICEHTVSRKIIRIIIIIKYLFIETNP